MSSPPGDLPPAVDLTTVSASRHRGVDVVSVVGELDVRRERCLRRVVDDPAQVNQQQVVIDLSAVTFIDARGIGAIVYCRRTLARRCADLSLICPEGQPLRILRLVGLERILPIYPDRENALRERSLRTPA